MIIYIKHFINILGLYLSDLNEENLVANGFTEKAISQIKALKIKYPRETQVFKQADTKDDPKWIEDLTNVFENERVDFLIKRAKEEGAIVPVEGAAEMIRSIREEGYKVAVVTQSPLILAREILEKVGLLEYETKTTIGKEPGYVGKEYKQTRIARQDFDFIVTGRPVKNFKNFKPHPEHLLRGTAVPLWKEALKKAREGRETDLSLEEKRDLFAQTWDEAMGDLRPVVHIGDSGSDGKAALDLGIPCIIIRTPYTNEKKLRDELKVAWIVDDPREITARLIDEVQVGRQPELNAEFTQDLQIGKVFPNLLQKER